MLRIFLISELLVVLLVITCISCCQSGIKNCSVSNNSLINFTRTNSDFDKVIKLDELSHLINDNEDDLFEDLPHYIVPEISNYERDFINVLSQKYLKLQQPFDLSHVSGISTECRKSSHKFVESLKSFELWALQMNDATAKITSGVLNGNINQFGDFDECLNVEAPDGDFQGKYCLAYLQPTVSKSLKYTNYLRKLMSSFEAFRTTLDDPGHRVPRFLTINWGVCIPSTCTNREVELAIKQFAKRSTNGTGIDLDIRVESEMCQVRNKNWMRDVDSMSFIAILFCLSIVSTTFITTVYDYFASQETKSDWLTSFSLIRNTKSLLSTDRSSDDIKTAHAIRFFNAVMLVLSHKCMAVFFNPYSNRTEMMERLGKPWTVLARAASLYTDPFLMLSGMLTTYSLIGKLQRNGRINISKEIIGRYFRIMPPLAFLILFCTFVLPLLGDGPQWNLVVTHHATICKQHWWRNLLFIHNWFGFSNLCLTHTHHVGIDTELFWIAPFLILVLWKWPKRGLQMIIGLAALSTVARYYVTYKYGLSNYVFFGASTKKLFETADRMYINPPHRFTVYGMGMVLGWILRKFKDLKLSEKQVRVGWYVSIASVLWAFLRPAPMGDINYKYESSLAANYAAFAPIAWCIFFGWIILVSELGYKNKFTRALEWRGFLVCTKLSYSLYLTQFPVFFYNIGQVRTPIHYGFWKIFLNTNEYLWIVVVTVMLTLFVEMPCNNIKSLLFDRKKTGQTTTKAQHLDVNSNIKSKEL